MNPCVKAATAGDDYSLGITFSNVEVGVFDCTPCLSQTSEIGAFSIKCPRHKGVGHWSKKNS